MRRLGLATLFLLIANILFVFVVDIATIKPHRISGNGNPGIVALGMGWLLLAIFGVSFLIWLSRWKRSRRTDAVLFFVSIFLLGTAVWMEIRHVADLLDALGGGFGDPESRIFRFGKVNQYTNTFYYNGYVIAAVIGLLAAARSGADWVGRRRVQSSN